MNALGVGIIGAGPVTQAIHLPTLARLPDEYRVTHVMDIDPSIASAVASRVDATWSTSVDELLADPTVDVVAICSPPAFHAEQVQAAIAAGARGILCEKPFAVSSAEAETLAEVARDSRTPLVVGAMHAYDPAWIAAQEAWGDLAATAHTVRSSIVLPQNRRYEGWATETLERPSGGVGTEVRRPATRFRDAILGLAIHDVPLIRSLAPAIDRVADAEVLEPFGYAVSAEADGRRVELFAHMHHHWRPAWTFEAWSSDARLRLDFTPSYVHAGSAVATLATPHRVVQLGPFETNGYVEEWRHLARLANGQEQPADELGSMIEDLEYALRIADGPVRE